MTSAQAPTIRKRKSAGRDAVQRFSIACQLALCVLALLVGAAKAHGQEIRAFWADAFSPAIKSKDEVHDLLRRVRMANCNAVFVQVRKGGDAYYVSRYEPWASDNPERFDGLAYLIEQAHAGKPRISVHAWINTCAVGRSHGNPRHVAISHPEWLSLSNKGADYDGEATKIDPGHPDAADHTFRIYLDVARHYDVDGIHFDFVRYGGTEWGYNPVNVARFNARYGRTGLPAPSDPVWMQWRRDQVTALVRKVYALAAAVKPRLVVSAATITWGKGPETLQEWNTKSAAMTRVFQDWRSWMAEGILDLNCLMSYYREARHAEWFRLWIDWAKDNQFGRWAIPSSGVWLNPIRDSLRQIEAIRAPSKRGNRGRGVLLYCYASTNVGADGSEQRYNEEFYKALAVASAHGTAPFAKPAAEPQMPWKVRPTRGHIYGFVRDANSLEPVDGAIVTLTGSNKRVGRTDGTGFYAFVDVAPGPGTVTISGAGYASKRSSVQVTAGASRCVGFLMGAPNAPYTQSLSEARSAQAGAPIRLHRALVVGGTDNFVGRLFIASTGEQAALRVELRPDGAPPVQSGDVVAVIGRAGTVDGERAIVDATAALADMQAGQREVRDAVWRLPGKDGPAVGTMPAAGIGRIAGLVTGHGDGVLTLSGPCAIEVRLDDRKGCGVEDEPTPIIAPSPASRITVTGVVTLATRDGRTLVRIWPRTPDDIQVNAGPEAAVFGALAGVLGPPFRDGNGLLGHKEAK